MTPERRLRIVKYAFVVSCLMFFFVTLKIPAQAPHPPARSLELILVALVLIELGLGFAARPFLARLVQANARGSRDATAPVQWMSTNLVSLAMIESCALFAVVLHFLGSSQKLVGSLFGCALLALLIWAPGTPPLPDNGNGASH